MLAENASYFIRYSITGLIFEILNSDSLISYHLSVANPPQYPTLSAYFKSSFYFRFSGPTNKSFMQMSSAS